MKCRSTHRTMDPRFSSSRVSSTLSAYAESVGLSSTVNSLGSHPCALPGEVSCAHRQVLGTKMRTQTKRIGLSIETPQWAEDSTAGVTRSWLTRLPEKWVLELQICRTIGRSP